MKKIFILGAALLGTVTLNAQTYKCDAAHSSLGFIITHLKISELPGAFKKFDAKMTATKEDFSDAVVELNAETNSVYTGNDGRDKHLTSADFFDAEKNPTLTFKSTEFKKEKGKMYKVTGDLTFHGVTKPVTLEAEYKGKTVNRGSDVYVWKIHGKIKRSDFGIAPNMPNDAVDDVVNLNADLEFGIEK
jgi:polyisoprenoid-binding protein YceI